MVQHIGSQALLARESNRSTYPHQGLRTTLRWHGRHLKSRLCRPDCCKRSMQSCNRFRVASTGPPQHQHSTLLVLTQSLGMRRRGRPHSLETSLWSSSLASWWPRNWQDRTGTRSLSRTRHQSSFLPYRRLRNILYRSQENRSTDGELSKSHRSPCARNQGSLRRRSHGTHP